MSIEVWVNSWTPCKHLLQARGPIWPTSPEFSSFSSLALQVIGLLLILWGLQQRFFCLFVYFSTFLVTISKYIISTWIHLMPSLILNTVSKQKSTKYWSVWNAETYRITMLHNRNWCSVVGQLYFKNKWTKISQKKRSDLWLLDVAGGRGLGAG